MDDEEAKANIFCMVIEKKKQIQLIEREIETLIRIMNAYNALLEKKDG
jgi:hypothetical protein